MTTCKLVFEFFTILVSLYLDIIAIDDNTTVLGGILSNFLCFIVIK